MCHNKINLYMTQWQHRSYQDQPVYMSKMYALHGSLQTWNASSIIIVATDDMEYNTISEQNTLNQYKNEVSPEIRSCARILFWNKKIKTMLKYFKLRCLNTKTKLIQILLNISLVQCLLQFSESLKNASYIFPTSIYPNEVVELSY